MRKGVALALCDEQQSRLPLLCLRPSSLITHSSFVLVSEQGKMLPGQKTPVKEACICSVASFSPHKEETVVPRGTWGRFQLSLGNLMHLWHYC